MYVGFQDLEKMMYMFMLVVARYVCIILLFRIIFLWYEAEGLLYFIMLRTHFTVMNINLFSN